MKSRPILLLSSTDHFLHHFLLLGSGNVFCFFVHCFQFFSHYLASVFVYIRKQRVYFLNFFLC